MAKKLGTVHENSTVKIAATICDENGAAIAASSLTTLTLTLYDKTSGTVINSRDGQNVLNTNNVTVSSAGTLVWTMQPADNVIIGTVADGQTETHVALWEWTWASGAKGSNHEQEIKVEQIDKVP